MHQHQDNGQQQLELTTGLLREDSWQLRVEDPPLHQMNGCVMKLLWRTDPQRIPAFVCMNMGQTGVNQICDEEGVRCGQAGTQRCD